MEVKRVGIVCVTHYTGVQAFNRLLKKEGDDVSAYKSHQYCCISEGMVELKELGAYEVTKVRTSDSSHISEELKY